MHHGPVDLGDRTGGGGIGANLKIKVVTATIRSDVHRNRCARTKYRVNGVQFNRNCMTQWVMQLGTPPCAAAYAQRRFD
jgi:hypothetical protein